MLKKKQLGFIISHLSEGIMMFMVDLVTREPLILKTIQLDQLVNSNLLSLSCMHCKSLMLSLIAYARLDTNLFSVYRNDTIGLMRPLPLFEVNLTSFSKVDTPRSTFLCSAAVQELH